MSMAPRPVSQRKGTAGNSSVAGIAASDIGTPGSGNNGMSSRTSAVSLSSRTSATSCPPIQPKAPALRKNSPVTGSSNGLNSKTSGGNTKATSSSTSKKPPPGPPSLPGKVVGHAYLKASKSSSLIEPGLQSTNKPKSCTENGNHEGEENGNQEQEQVGDTVADQNFLNNTPANEKVPCEENMMPNNMINGNEGINPFPSGPIKNFLGRENGQHHKSKSVPTGLGLCYGISNSAPTSQQNLYHPEPESSYSPAIIGIGQLCSPTCNGLHYCLQMIGTGQPMPNNKPSTPPPYNGTNKYTHTINGVSINGHGMVNGHEKLSKPASFQEAFGHLLKIRNVLNESGICSLEDHQHVAAIETLLLKVFSQGGSKFHN